MDSNWLAQRKKGIGGSDAGAICGVSKYRTPLQVYEDKLGIAAPTPDNPSMAYGRLMEPVIRQWYANETGREVIIPDGILYHPEHDFILANLDGCTKDGRVLEIKTTRSGAEWGDPGTDEIPISYLFQVQHYMMVTGYKVADVAVSIGGAMPQLYEVPADEELQSMLLQKESDFWQMVKTQTPPEPVNYADIIRKFSKSIAAQKMSTQEIDESLAMLKNVQVSIKELEGQEEYLKSIIMQYLEESDTLVAPDGKVLATWKSAKPTARFDSKALQIEHPDIYSQYCKMSEASRRFLLK